MSLQRYAQYKDSAIQWVGDIPVGWQVRPLLGVARERFESNVGMKEANLLSLSYGRIVQKDMQSNDGLLPESFETYQIVCPGDVVFRLTDLQNDKRSLRTASVSEIGIITSAYLCVEPKEVEASYFSYLLRFYDLSKVFYSMGGGLRQSMKYDDVKRIPVLVPPRSEQVAIASFLDREAAKIDALIAEQEKLLALLAEKRLATISHAVTRGLDPNAPMKDSGIPWLGEVPAHWEVLPVRRVVQEHRQGYYSEAPYVDDGVGLLRITDLRADAGISYEECPRVADESAVTSFFVRRGDFLFARTGGAGLFGVVGEVDAPTAYAAYLIRFRFNMEMETEYLRWFFLSSAAQSAIAQQIHGGVNKNVHAEDIKSLCLAKPPMEEQISIAAAVSSDVDRFNCLVGEVSTAIKLMTERRSALISAAVTGKIDVRQAA